MICLALAILIAGVIYIIIDRELEQEASRLNVCVHRRHAMAKIGDTLNVTIAPTTAAGQPAPVFGVVYDPDSAGFDGYDVTPSPDGLSAVLVAKASGTGFKLTVSATTKSGAPLSETVDLPDIDAPVDEEAVALNITVA